MKTILLFLIQENKITNSFHVSNCFSSLVLICQTVEVPQRLHAFLSNSLNVISFKRGEFEFPIGGMTNNVLHMVQESLNILQLALCWQSQDFKLAVKVKAAAQ